MIKQQTRITITLSMDEWSALRERALYEYRHPRDQARYILRNGLGLSTNEIVIGQGDTASLQPVPTTGPKTPG